MNVTKRMPNYNKEPEITIKGYEQDVWEGYSSILNEVRRKISHLDQNKVIITLECYPGVREEEVFQAFQALNPTKIIHADHVTVDAETIASMIHPHLTDDRVFGIMSNFSIHDFMDENRLESTRTSIQEVEKGIVLIYGVGASVIHEGDIVIYADLARWEIQKRYRSQEMGNWKTSNEKEDILRKYKQGYFFEWRMADKIKKELFEKLDYLLDTNQRDNPKMVSKDAYLYGLKQVAKQPFRTVPYFDPGVWGGQWMKEVCRLDKNEKNFAWSFDGVPEENSLYLTYGNIRVEIPAINLVFYQPVQLLGDKIHARFGTEFPIRFDLLDTIDGEHLSLQVHPLTEYIRETFGMSYTQDESYYILDAKDEAVVYLGQKEGINPAEMIDDLKQAQKGNLPFPDEKYINQFPAKKHDHFSIPAGTVHCSGKNTMVLEISATPYIFTFKLWDWNRVGLDGKPRPVHIEHGEQVIQWDRSKAWVEKNLINRVEVLEKGEGWIEERTGLHELEFIETRRHWFTSKVSHNTMGIVNILNLIEGEEAIVESPNDSFEPFIVHYAETFIIPAQVGEYTIRPYGLSEGKEIGTIKAFVRT